MLRGPICFGIWNLQQLVWIVSFAKEMGEGMEISSQTPAGRWGIPITGLVPSQEWYLSILGKGTGIADTQ